MRTVITKEFEVIICDICGKESEHTFKCQICRKDVCSNCRAWNMCKPCWENNCSFATITSNITEENGYESRLYTTTIKHESQNKWKDLLSRFHGERVKITIEEFPKHEEVKLKYKFEAIDGDNTKEWLEKCASLGIK